VAKVRLARNQAIYADGVALLGTRDFEIDQETDGVDVTPWTASGTAELSLCESATLTLQVYHLEDAQRLAAKWNAFPPQPVVIAIDNAGTGQFVVKSVKTSGGFGGVLSYSITLKSWPYQ
jgi:hypothetical protein